MEIVNTRLFIVSEKNFILADIILLKYSPDVVNNNIISLVKEAEEKAIEHDFSKVSSLNAQLCIHVVSGDVDLRLGLNLSEKTIQILSENNLSLDFDPY